METGIISPSGRIGRGAFWLRWLICVVINVIATRVAIAIDFPLLGTIISLPVSVFIIIQGIKRVHDVGKPGWFVIIPIYNLILFLSGGTAGPNEYGADPAGGAAAAKT
jgi:uncharacterized membrane protein YhaH (DUF805 family)